ncbi:MAG: hypothetical protein ABW157_21880 [Candidatus Thiodiazotropha sp. LLP2]
MKKNSLLTVLGAILVMTGGCFATTKALQPHVETLHGFSLTSTLLTFSVTSNGCTESADFDIVIQHAAVPQLTIVRKKKDTCRRKRIKVDIEYPLSRLKIDSATTFTIDNTFSPFKKQKYD